MVVGDWALILNLVSIGLLGLFILHALQSIFWLFISEKLADFSPKSRKSLLLVWVACPYVLSTVITLFFYLSITGPFELLDEVAHWHHAYVFHFDSWHGFLLLGFIAYIVWQLSKVIRRWVIHSSDIKSLNLLSRVISSTSNSNSSPEVSNYYLLDSAKPAAFVAGIIKPRCYLTNGLKRQLTEEELNIVLQHEQAHLTSNDALSKCLFNLLCIFYPGFTKKPIKMSYALALEQIADQKVLKSHTGFDVAATLVKVAKLQNSYKTDFSYCYFGSEHIALRVNELITPGHKKSFPIIISLISLALLLFSTLSVIDVSHHLIESLFTH